MSTGDEQNNTSALARLLNQLNLPTLGLILLMGGGNWFATKSTSEEQRAEIQRAIRQVHDLHSELSEWETRQKDGLTNQREILRMLSEQQSVLNQLKNR